MHARLNTRFPRLACALALSLSLALTSCGGGVGTGGTGGESYAAGPITGFGSVIVGGVRFDDTAATVEDGEGGVRSRDELRLGMTVEVNGSAITTGSSGPVASASRIRFESELSGLVGLVDAAGGSFTMLGQRVTVDDSTVFDERLTGGLAGLGTGQPLEVFASFDAAGQRYRATRIEPAALARGLRLRGQVSQVDTVARTLRVGGVSYSYAGATHVPAGLAAGQFVRLRMEFDLLPAPRWVVQSFGLAWQPLADADGLKVEGLISSFTSSSSFSVNGRTVNATAASFPDGTAGLALGVRVEVEGAVRSGVLQAAKVSIESDDDVRDRGFELEGAISTVDTLGRTITVRGVLVGTARPDLRLEGGVESDLRVGRRVEVRGVLAPDRRSVDATRIRFR
ncbi:MAG: DUF5666 domain-containing protein [Rubrivivax sp.]|nr:DUF5666 domain-containing protein [Rubrivivax sp.]MDP3223776.1 DUF5666 domain-containing protein [Rubrivivax sp.]